MTKLDPESLVALRREHGSLRKAAAAIGVDPPKVFRAWRDAGLPSIGRDGLTDDERAQRARRVGVTFGVDDDGEVATLTARGDAREVALGDVDALLRERGLEPDEWDVVSLTVNEWDGPVSGGGTQKLRQLKATLRPRRVLATLLRPAEIPEAIPPAASKPSTAGHRLGVLTGCWQYPYADPGFEACFEAWLAYARPDFGIDLGDGMDLPTISRHRDNPSHSASPQACVDAYGAALYRRRVASPDTAWTVLLGNHDVRFLTEQLQRAERLAGLRPAVFPGDTEDPEALFSPRRILRLDELGIEAVLPPGGDYRFAEVEIAPGLIAIHGDKTDAKRAAADTVRQYGASVVMAHTHRQRLYSVRLPRGTGQAVDAVGVEVGCGCRIDGGLGYTVRPDWTNGFATVSIDADGEFVVEFARFSGGVLRWRDVTIRAE